MMTTPNQNQIKTYHGYRILKKADIEDNLRSMLNVVTRCRDAMTKPKMMHYVCEIEDFDLFPNKFIQSIKEKFKSEWKKFERKRHADKPRARRRRLPNLEIIYSIEAKDIDNPKFNAFDPDQPPKLRYNHVHIMLIIDVGSNIYDRKEITSITNRALNRIHGVKKLVIEDDFNITTEDGHERNRGFLKFRDTRSTTKTEEEFLDLYWHDLKQEFDDALIRASYLCKSEQKALLPERFKNSSFNVTRAVKQSEAV